MNPAIQSRLIGPCLEGNTSMGRHPLPDVPALLRRLLLFELYILQSVRLTEFPTLVRTLGARNVVALLDSGALKVELDPNQIAQVGQCKPVRGNRGTLPRGSVEFSLILIEGGNYDTYLHRCIEEVHDALLGVIPSTNLRKVEEAIVRALLPRPSSSSAPSKAEALQDLVKELRAGSPLLKRSLIFRLRQVGGIEVAEDELEFRVVPINETDFKLESNLARFGLSEEESHKWMEGACLGVGSLCSRIEEMKTNDALSGCVDHELALFIEKFQLLADVLVSGSNKERFDAPLRECEADLGRVLRIATLPTFDLRPPNKSFDMERFLDVRASKEAAEFRTWLQRIHSATDSEIRDQIHPFRTRVGGFLETTAGRVLRFAVSSISSMAADAFAPGSGLMISGLDSFLIDKVLRPLGPTLFLSRKYASLFAEPQEAEIPMRVGTA